MTALHGWVYGDLESRASVNGRTQQELNGVVHVADLDERMTILEAQLGTALWQHAKVKIPRDALVRVANDMRMSFGDERCNRLSSTTYGQFYSGQVGAPHIQHYPAADQVANMQRAAVLRDPYKDAHGI